MNEVGWVRSTGTLRVIPLSVRDGVRVKSSVYEESVELNLYVRGHKVSSLFSNTGNTIANEPAV